MTETQFRNLEKILRKLHRIREHIFFLNKCTQHEILPNFTNLSHSTIEKLQLKKPQIMNHRYKIFNNALENQNNKLNHNTLLLNNLYHQIYTFNPHNANRIISIIKSRIINSEFRDDKNRQIKLNKRIQAKSNHFEPPKITIHNFTDITLPKEIEKILEKGIHGPVGGYSNKKMILAKFEETWKIWYSEAQKSKLDIFQINHVKSELFLAFEQLKNCSTKNDSQILKKYLDANPHIIITESDKTKNLNILNHTDYVKKLDQIFEKSKFQKLKSNPLNVDLAAYRKVINEIKPNLSNKNEYLLTPTESLKRGYGIPKNTKPNLPLRPIVSSLNSITNGGEKYLHNLIAPIIKKCKYSLYSTKEFKNKFSKIQQFDDNEFEVICLDCVSLYTSVDLKLVLDFIIDSIYSDKDRFFRIKQKQSK